MFCSDGRGRLIEQLLPQISDRRRGLVFDPLQESGVVEQYDERAYSVAKERLRQTKSLNFQGQAIAEHRVRR